MPWYLYLALKQLFAGGQRIFFTAISILSVTLGVALMIIVLSVMGGFGAKIREMTQDTQGDVQIRADQHLDDAERLRAVIQRVPGVVATTPFAQGFVMILHQGRPTGTAIQGIDLANVEKVAPLGKYIVEGSLDALDDDSVILSSGLADTVGASIGSKVEVLSPTLFLERNKSDEYLLPRELTVVGIFRFGHQQLDSSTALVTLRAMQDLYGLGHEFDGINVRIQPKLDADVEAARINAALDQAQGHELPHIEGLVGSSWRQLNASFLWALQMEKSIMTLILLMVVLVAAFLTMSLLIVLVLKKTREIGLLAALGATRIQLAMCFCFQGVCIGLVGTAAGVVFGFTVLHFRDGLVEFVTRLTGGQGAMANVYEFTELPANISGNDLAVVIISAVIASTLAGIVPALLAARLKPAEALRNE